jgi:hypothetical protein
MIKKFEQFNINTDRLFYYCFDWDDNLLYMPTKIHMEKKEGDTWIPISVSTKQFSEIRNNNDWKLLNDDPDQAFSEFRDYGKRGDTAFIEDVKISIRDEKFGPSWGDFIECLSNGAIFAIITARGHESKIIKNAVKWIIDNCLNDDQIYTMYNNLLKFSYFFSTDTEEYSKILDNSVPSESKLIKDYLEHCDFVGVSAPSRGGSAKNPEKAKEIVLLEFKEKINKYAERRGAKAIIGFSDDDVKNVKHVEDLVDNLNKERFPNIIKYVIKGTKDPENITKKVRLIETSHQTPGLESSVLRFSQFGNMTGHLYPTCPHGRQDDGLNAFKRATEYLAKISVDKNKKIRKRKKKN